MLLCPASSFVHTTYQKKKVSTLPGIEDGAWHLQVASLHLIAWAVCSVPFFLVSDERSGRNRPRREALVSRNVPGTVSNTWYLVCTIQYYPDHRIVYTRRFAWRVVPFFVVTVFYLYVLHVLRIHDRYIPGMYENHYRAAVLS